MPGRPQDQANSTDFFKSLLNTADRFSFIVNPDDNRTEYSSFAWYGFEYALLERQDKPGELIGTITLVVPGGPADQKGLKRGDLFTAVNGIALTTAKAEQVNRIMRLGDGLQLSTAALVGGALQAGPIVSVNYSHYNELPVYTSKVFNAGGKKAGYIFYNQFNGNYDRQILDVLAVMRSESISDLILDLRYNPGGDVSTAAKLSGALSKATADQTFVVYQANSTGEGASALFRKPCLKILISHSPLLNCKTIDLI